MPVIDDWLMDEVMTPDPTSIDINTSFAEAYQMMQSRGMRYLPVTDNGVVKSVINCRDMARYRSPAHFSNRAQILTLRNIGTTKMRVADVNDPLGRILKVIVQESVEAVILLRNGGMAGIFTEADACRILAKHLGYKL